MTFLHQWMVITTLFSLSSYLNNRFWLCGISDLQQAQSLKICTHQCLFVMVVLLEEENKEHLTYYLLEAEDPAWLTEKVRRTCTKELEIQVSHRYSCSQYILNVLMLPSESRVFNYWITEYTKWTFFSLCGFFPTNMMSILCSVPEGRQHWLKLPKTVTKQKFSCLCKWVTCLLCHVSKRMQRDQKNQGCPDALHHSCITQIFKWRQLCNSGCLSLKKNLFYKTYSEEEIIKPIPRKLSTLI